jgi:two-component system sensor histidine kinase YesM
LIITLTVLGAVILISILRHRGKVSFRKMKMEVDQLKRERKELLRQKEESVYKALQLQIPSHFLYNALDSINCLSRIYGKDDISEMIVSLGDIFRYSTHTNQYEVTLKEEVKHVKNYCMLQAIRYQDNFLVEYKIDDKYDETRVIKFMIQPLVENAIQHGMDNITKGGKIVIGALELDDMMHIYVWDNGYNFSQEVFEKYQFYFSREEPEDEVKSEKIGILNVHRRLRMMFGIKAGINIDLSEGTKVCIMIPKRGEDIVSNFNCR